MNAPLAEIPSFQKFFITAQTAKMADFMFQNMAYRATVYRTGGLAIATGGEEEEGKKVVLKINSLP